MPSVAACAVADPAAANAEDWELHSGWLTGASRRGREFSRLVELHGDLKRRCSVLQHFARRDFAAVAEAAPEHTRLCEGSRLTESPSKFAKSLEALAQRAEDRGRLQIAFVGPANAGKTALVNALLAEPGGDGEPLLPCSHRARTRCVWRVRSCEGATATVSVDGSELRSWRTDASDPTALASARAELASCLRHAAAEQASEVEVSLPLAMANPFGCQYCLVDTPSLRQSLDYEASVDKYLHDHCHLVCVVCNLCEGKTAAQAMRSVAESARGRVFWVLTHLDRLAERCGGGGAGRQLAEQQLHALVQELREVDASMAIFKYVAQAPGPAVPSAARGADAARGPPRGRSGGEEAPRPRAAPGADQARGEVPAEADAAERLEDIRGHAKDRFLQLQRQKHILSGLSRRCLEAVADLIGEYADLKDASAGTCDSEYLARELQASADEVVGELEREVARQVEDLKGAQLERLCSRAAEALRLCGRRPPSPPRRLGRAALSRRLALFVQLELRRRVAAAVARAHRQLAEAARKLVAGVGLEEAELLGPGSAFDVKASAADGLKESCAVDAFPAFPLNAGPTLPAAAAAWCAAAIGDLQVQALQRERSPLLLSAGLRLAVATVLRVAGFAAAPLAALGCGARKALPLWKSAALEADVVAELRQAGRWSPLVELEAGRARAQLLRGVARFRCSLSLALLRRGAPRPALERLFPELPLLEEVQRSVEGLSGEVQELAEAPDLSPCSGEHLQQCRTAFRAGAWERVAELTAPYAAASARTDAAEAEVLAGLLHLRCHALVLADRHAEACEAAEAFGQAFPGLAAPPLHRAVARLRLRLPRGRDDGGPEREALLSEVRRLSAEPPGSAPPALELSFLALAASWLRSEESKERLLTAARLLVSQQMRSRPSLEDISATAAGRLRSHSALFKEFDLELSRFIASLGRRGELLPSPPKGHVEARRAWEEVRESYAEECSAYARAVVRRVRELLGCVAPAHVDMDAVGRRPLADAILEQISLELARPPAMEPFVEMEVRSLLCTAEGGLHNEWFQALGKASRGCLPGLPPRALGVVGASPCEAEPLGKAEAEAELGLACARGAATQR